MRAAGEDEGGGGGGGLRVVGVPCVTCVGDTAVVLDLSPRGFYPTDLSSKAWISKTRGNNRRTNKM